MTIFLLTQTRTSNTPLFLLFNLLAYFLSFLGLSPLETTTTIILLQHVSFFAFGGSNAISSIDLSLAYNGVSGFNVVTVGILTFVSNWAGPIWWALKGTELLSDHAHSSPGTTTEVPKPEGQPVLAPAKVVQQQHIALLTVFVTAHLVFVMAACTALRTHLFIWTVFSPKFLYSMAWSLGLHFLINIGLGSALFALGSA